MKKERGAVTASAERDAHPLTTSLPLVEGSKKNKQKKKNTLNIIITYKIFFFCV